MHTVYRAPMGKTEHRALQLLMRRHRVMAEFWRGVAQGPKAEFESVLDAVTRPPKTDA